jgi:pyruvate,water dikinase
MATALCAWFNEVCRNDVTLVGGKGANLGDMVRADLPIPPGFVVCAPAYQQMARSTGMDARLRELLAGVDYNNPAQLAEAEQQAHHWFESVIFDDDLSRSIVEAYRQLGPQTPVAVRSSATAEDLAGASFAGQQETFLNVLGEAELLRAVGRCWASLYTSRAIFYRQQKGFDSSQVSMAVVVQKMVNSDKSGVLFTVDPVLGNPYQMVIEAVWGLGEGIVSGMITPDHYKVDRESYEIVYDFIPEKPRMIAKDSAGGVLTLPVPADRVSARILSTEELRGLVDLGNKVEQHFGGPQDVEWGIEDGRIYLLQSRPITNL